MANSTASLEPGRHTISFSFTQPARARLIIALAPIDAKERLRKSSPNPSRRFSKKGATVSIVTSFFPNPVPPVKKIQLMS